MDLLLQYMLDAPQLIKDMREKKERDERERRERYAVDSFNEGIIKSQAAQYESAMVEVKLYKELQDLEGYIVLLENQMAGFSEKEKELGHFWIRIVRDYAKRAHPISKRLKQLQKTANASEGSYYDQWCKESKEYTPK